MNQSDTSRMSPAVILTMGRIVAAPNPLLPFSSTRFAYIAGAHLFGIMLSKLGVAAAISRSVARGMRTLIRPSLHTPNGW